MIFTIEPMINAGKRDIKEDRKGNRPYDGWTIVTRDRSLSAQWKVDRQFEPAMSRDEAAVRMAAWEHAVGQAMS